MTATNHALTGALLGFAITNPFIVLPLAFLSHFAQDAIPHYDPPGNEYARLSSKRFSYELLAQAISCFVLVLILAAFHPQHWLLASTTAFLATSADLLWIPKFWTAKHSRKLLKNDNWFWRFHAWIQWRTGPKLVWVEALWFVVFGVLLLKHL